MTRDETFILRRFLYFGEVLEQSAVYFDDKQYKRSRIIGNWRDNLRLFREGGFLMNYMTIEELSSLVRAPKTTVYRWTSERSIPFIKLGRRLLFDRAEIDRWLEAKRVRANG